LHSKIYSADKKISSLLNNSFEKEKNPMNPLNRLLRKLPIIKHKINKQDNRSYHFIAVIDCILNQNVRDKGAAAYPAMNWEIIQLCKDYNIGILQMSCPEIAFLGFPRTRPPGVSIRVALDTTDGRVCCRKLSIDIADRIEELIQQGAQCLAVLGGNPESPGCAIPLDNKKQSVSGVFISELGNELHQRNISIPFRGIRDFDADLMVDDIQWLKQLFSKS